LTSDTDPTQAEVVIASIEKPLLSMDTMGLTDGALPVSEKHGYRAGWSDLASLDAKADLTFRA